jgi:hypothetical protein
VVWERRSTHPILNMAFFANPRFSIASLSLALASFAMLGTVFVLTLHLQFVLGSTPLQAGVRMLPVLTLMVSAPLSARVVQWVGTKAAVVAGMLITAAGLWLFSTAGVADGYGPVGAALAVLGIGLGLVFAPATDTIMGSLPLAKTGVGSAMNDTTRLVGGALGVAVFGTVMSSAYASRIAPALSGLPAPAAAAAQDSVGGAMVVAGRLGPDGGALIAAARSASVDAMGYAILVGVAVVVVGALVALLFLPSRPIAAVGGQTEPLRAGREDQAGYMHQRPLLQPPMHQRLRTSRVRSGHRRLPGVGENLHIGLVLLRRRPQPSRLRPFQRPHAGLPVAADGLAGTADELSNPPFDAQRGPMTQGKQLPGPGRRTATPADRRDQTP